MPLPTATTFIEIDRQSQLAGSVDGSTKVSLAGVSPTPLDGVSAISDEVLGGKQDEESADEDPVGDGAVLADEAVLTVNEVEEVLRDAFKEADQLASIVNDQEGTTSVGDNPTLVPPGPSPDCTGIRHYPNAGHDPGRRGIASPRTSDQGNDHLHSKPSGLSDPF